MEACKHELKDLIGMADGIHCRKCGAVFKDLPKPVNKLTEKLIEDAPKKEGRKNARRSSK